MTTPTREDLLGFVLGALDAAEHQQVADCLRTHVDLQHELRRIQSLLAPLESCHQPAGDFPVGLARRTCEIVARESRQSVASPRQDFPADLSQQANQRLVALPTERAVKPRQVRESAVLVCCAAVLGAAIGTTALQFTRALTVSPAASRNFATHRPHPRPATSAATTRVDNALFDSSNLAFVDGKTRSLGELKPEWRQLFASGIGFHSVSSGSIPNLGFGLEMASPQQTANRAIYWPTTVHLPLDLSASLISLGAQAAEPMFAADSIPLENAVGQWNDWRPLADDGIEENRTAADFCSLGRIGQRPFIRPFADAPLQPVVQFISN